MYCSSPGARRQFTGMQTAPSLQAGQVSSRRAGAGGSGRRRGRHGPRPVPSAVGDLVGLAFDVGKAEQPCTDPVAVPGLVLQLAAQRIDQREVGHGGARWLISGGRQAGEACRDSVKSRRGGLVLVADHWELKPRETPPPLRFKVAGKGGLRHQAVAENVPWLLLQIAGDRRPERPSRTQLRASHWQTSRRR